MSNDEKGNNANHGKKEEGGIGNSFRNFCRFLYNPQQGTVMERTPSSWAQIGVFYLIFYSCLAGFFAIQMAIFFVTISSDEPKLQSKASLLKGFPGMGFRPQPKLETTLVRFDQGVPESYGPFISHIQSYLENYENEAQDNIEELQDCNDLVDKRDNQVCRFNLDRIATSGAGLMKDGIGPECIKEKDFGYDEGQPCVLLKLNKIYGWEPDLYQNISEIDDEGARESLEGRFNNEFVGVTCEGENPADQENMGPIEYWPPSGFHKQYYPYLHQEGYRQPLVMVKFRKPKNGVLMQIWCKAWAKNIYHHRNDRAGSVRFELMVD